MRDISTPGHSTPDHSSRQTIGKSQDRLCLLNEITVSACNYFLPRYASLHWGFKQVNNNSEAGSKNWRRGLPVGENYSITIISDNFLL
ncbi:hypothetical protein [Dickeya solani]|uniref:Uncharacterized protein n=1 Tax=Dickeya solani TaxID=1089444 RepID=A0AAX4EY86_9GAMM|nr:hypothetical protein [Dickeya solani]WOA52006.1 hypothetical protein RXA29_19275 [Dickeya solani]